MGSDISGLPRVPRVEAMVTVLDALNLPDDDRVAAMTAYFKSLAQAQAAAVESVYLSEGTKPLSPEMEDWLRRFQEGCIRMANDEGYRKTIAARLF